jgi:hypothetical protein
VKYAYRVFADQNERQARKENRRGGLANCLLRLRMSNQRRKGWNKVLHTQNVPLWQTLSDQIQGCEEILSAYEYIRLKTYADMSSSKKNGPNIFSIWRRRYGCAYCAWHGGIVVSRQPLVNKGDPHPKISLTRQARSIMEGNRISLLSKQTPQPA